MGTGTEMEKIQVKVIMDYMSEQAIIIIIIICYCIHGLLATFASSQREKKRKKKCFALIIS